jgi:putative FmdB family regulatory protein
MPLYEYLCEAGHRFERIVKFSDPPLEACPSCGARVEKLVSTPAFQFKGSGWYITDYPKKGSAESSPDSESSSGKSSDEGSAQPSDSASEKKPDSASAAPAATTAKESGS